MFRWFCGGGTHVNVFVGRLSAVPVGGGHKVGPFDEPYVVEEAKAAVGVIDISGDLCGPASGILASVIPRHASTRGVIRSALGERLVRRGFDVVKQMFCFGVCDQRLYGGWVALPQLPRRGHARVV